MTVQQADNDASKSRELDGTDDLKINYEYGFHAKCWSPDDIDTIMYAS